MLFTSLNMQAYPASKIEKKWQNRWRKWGLNRAHLKNPKKPSYYNLTMFPYPSGDRLHIGHWYNYGPVDSWGRYMKMKGYEIFQPMGFDAFGLPAENYAIKTGIHPAKITQENIAKMKSQIAAIGGIYDLEGNVDTSAPEYYKWTQWLFLELYKNGLAYRKEAPVNWCKSCMTVLANEQVVEGNCERCDTEVIQKNLKQWFFAITKYADKLLQYKGLDWPEKTMLMQKNWIGRKEGINIDYEIVGLNKKLTVFTTRPDTNFGATFIVLAPDSEFTRETLAQFPKKKEVEKYVEQTAKKTELERIAEGRKKTGVFTGLYAVNNLNRKKMPIFVGDFVLATVGTGNVVGVPGHDVRDFEFAKAMDLDVIRVVVGRDGDTSAITHIEQVQEEEGVMVNSEFLNGLTIHEATRKIMDYLEKKRWGKRVVTYRLRDWLISRQRYWGAPIPIIYCKKCGEIPVPEKDLPVVHPHVKNYLPKGTSPLATVSSFVNVSCPRCKKKAKREVDTMDTFVCSSWYFLRYPDAHNAKKPWDKKRVDPWLPVDMYIGGPEHACMHLLYARFIHRVMHDLGYVSTKEPFKRLVHQGMITKDGAKMSKSKGNVVSPDKFVEKYGSDVFRMYLMFMGPFTEGGDWNDRGILGVARFTDRFYRMISAPDNDAGMAPLVHQTVARASQAIEKMHFNSAIAALMEFTNQALKKPIQKKQKELLIRALAPLAPHLAEEVWELLGHKKSVFLEAWPKADPRYLKTETVTYAIQVNGKLRGTVDLDREVSKEKALESARKVANVRKYLEQGDVRKEIFVPGRIIGFVVSDTNTR